MSRIIFTGLLAVTFASTAHAAPSDYFAVKVVDSETSRGVPIVQLRTRSHLVYWTDSNGIAAIGDPGLMNQKVFFRIESDGYRFEDSFLGETGKVVDVQPGTSVTLPIRRVNIAERLYRVTGEGIYHDSVLTSQPVPLRNPLLSGGVVGQDTVIVCPYRGKLYWCWGDTNGLESFSLAVSGATSEWPGHGGLDPAAGVNLDYFVNSSGFSKAMCPFRERGLKWIEGLVTVKDETGRERLVTRYSNMRDLGHANDWGLLMYNDEKDEFERVVTWQPPKSHRSAHPFKVKAGGREMICIFPNLRVQADLAHLKDLKLYEAYSCLAPGTHIEPGKSPKLHRSADGKLVYGWKADTDAVDERIQRQLLSSGALKPGEAWYQLYDITTGKPVDSRHGSVCWNDYRKRWVLIASENAGQIWYAEADTPVGPWVYARKVVSHPRYNLYNPTQHPYFDQDNGRIIYFEGTYTDAFSGAPEKTPRYDYNQIMHRLTLGDSRLFLPAPVYRVEEADGSNRYMMRDAIESGARWDSVREIAFFALSPDRARKGCVPLRVGEPTTGAHLVADTSNTLAGEVLCHVPPSGARRQAPTDELTGRWQCKAGVSDGNDLKFPLSLQLKGDQVTGGFQFADRDAIKGTYARSRVEFTVSMGEEEFVIRGRLQDGQIRGRWSRADGSESGTFQAERDVEEGAEAATEAEVPLYAYTNGKSGAVRYSTKADWESPGFKRQADPVCNVWKNPLDVLILDPDAKPVPIVRP